MANYLGMSRYFAVLLKSPQQAGNKLATALSTGKLLGKVCNGFGA